MSVFGKLFVFEGPDGSGKTTLSRSFADHLTTCSIACEWFSFPGKEDGTLGKHVYEFHHDTKGAGIRTINPTSLQMLHVAAHIDAIECRIIPALKQGRHVVLDRFWWSTLVYGVVTGADRRLLKAMIDIEGSYWGGIRPAVAFLVRRASQINEVSLLAEEYEKLVALEARKHPVTTIDNDGTIAKALESIIQSAKIETPLHVSPGQRTAQSRVSKPSAQHHGSFMNLPLVFSKLQPAKPTIVYDTYWRFAAERQDIFFRRLRDEPPPWTNDPILREYKFTNAYRASDRASQYMIRNVIYAGDQTPDEIFFRILLFKVFNRIETWELLSRALGGVSYRDYTFARYDAVLTGARNNGDSIYSAAYIMPSGGSSTLGGYKHRMHLKLIEQMLKDGLPSRLAETPSMCKAFELLRAYPTIGDFLAYQYVTDLNYSGLLNFSEMEFVVPGPGARDGIRKCFSDFGGLNEAELIKVVAERQHSEFERLGLKFQSLWGRPLQLIDCQNLFCEVDKYSRVKHPDISGHTGRTRIKQKYRVTTAPIPFWYPPKWGLNQLIPKGGLCVSSV